MKVCSFKTKLQTNLYSLEIKIKVYTQIANHDILETCKTKLELNHNRLNLKTGQQHAYAIKLEFGFKIN